MFEKYTEKARRVIFFARYEASQFGGVAIDSEHVLLGLMREDKGLTNRFFMRAQISIEFVRREIETRALPRDRVNGTVDLPLSAEARRVLAHAAEESERLAHRHIGTEHLLLGLLREENSLAAKILYDRGLRLHAVREELVRLSGGDRHGAQKKETPHLAEFSRNLTEAARDGLLDPLVGRAGELERVVQILCRRTKNNPVLIGEPGVGKTAIVEGLAQRIISGEVPHFLAEKQILALDLSLIVAGTKYRGQFEERLKTIMRELAENPQYIIFIDELHTLVGAGSAEGSLDAANILKPALSRGEIQCIGATTPAEFRKSIERDRSLERRFQAVKVPAPGEDEAVRILEGIKEKYEEFHQVTYTQEALEASVFQSHRYITDRFLPDKAIDIIDEAGARVKLRHSHSVGRRPPSPFGRERAPYAGVDYDHDPRHAHGPLGATSVGTLASIDAELKLLGASMIEVTKEDIEEVISRWTGIPIASLKEEEMRKLLRLEDELHNRIISQDRAISALARAIRRSRAGLKNPARPVGSFLFLGPTGVGKTEVARSLAEFLFGSERAMIRFDMSEFMEKHSVAKLIGSPPGYVGHEEGGQLTERIKRNPYSVLLFDEIEKAHPDVFNILLQVFEDGQLSDSLGNTIDFKNVIIIMTSNIGARFIQKKGSLGFQPSANAMQDKIEESVMGAVRQTFNPEFINRLDEIIIFEPLSESDLDRIVELLIRQMNRTIIQRRLSVSLAPESVRFIVEQTASERNYGARPLRRALQKLVEDPLSEAVIERRFEEGTHIEVHLENGELRFRAVPLEETADALVTR